MNESAIKYRTNDLKHHGILGQKWGVRRYQNEDGTLTEAGRRHIKYDKYGDYVEKELSTKNNNDKGLFLRKELRENATSYKKENDVNNIKGGLLGGASVAGGALAGGLAVAAGSTAVATIAMTMPMVGILSAGAYTVGKSMATSNKYQKMNNLLNTKYDELNYKDKAKRIISL